MAPTTLDKKWMKAPLGSEEYLDGVELFLKFIRVSLGKGALSSCPCFKCRNVVGGMVELKVIAEHLIINGVDQSYTSWYFHGEPIEESDDVYVDKFDEVLRQVCLDDVDDVMNEVSSDENFGVDNEINEQSTFSQRQTKFGSLWEDVRRPIYPLCKEELTKLSVTVELMSIKTKHQMSDNCFTDLLSYMRKILPEDNTLPHTVYEAKRMIKALGLEYETIHACPNDCMIYWSEDTNRQSCSKCGTSRWKTDEASDISNKKSSPIPAKVFRYFPLIPRLQRLYSVPWIAENMTWHSRVITDEKKMRHPVDSDSWSLIDAKWPTFSEEPRNVRLGLAVDGFNPFSYNSSYTCWPIMIVPYNLPPSICMNKEFIMLSTLIPGKNGPGKDIDVYLKPLVSELKLLWSAGTVTFDSHSQTEFFMKAVLLWAIHDLPAYSSLSGCRCGGKYGCPVCAEETYSIRLKHGNKNAYMGTRRNLPSNHPFRFQKRQFDGLEEDLIAPRRLSGSEVLNKVSKFETKYGKEKGKKSKKSIYDNGQTAWSKKSILFELPYWEDLEIRHNLDVMHVERNVAEILISTIMETDKSKDGTSARLDLKEMNIKPHLWPNHLEGSMPNASRPGRHVSYNIEGSIPNASRPGRHVSYNIEVDSSHLPRRSNSIGDDHLEDSSSASDAEMEDMASVDDFQRDDIALEDPRGDFARVSSSTSGFSAYQASKNPTGECKGKQKIIVDFDRDGLPVGDNASIYTSGLGQITRTHCPISIESFKDMSDTTKKAIWKHITDEFVVSDVYMKSQFKKIAKLFRERKHTLRKKYYDIYENDEERKRNFPTGVKREDWELFIQNEAKPLRKRKRIMTKAARQAMKAPHTSGRKGSARTMHALEVQYPTATFTRTDRYLAIHTRKDGTFLAPERMERIKAIIEDDPSSARLDLDHDPVYQVCGKDKYGSVRGYGVGVLKTSLVSSAPAKEQLQLERQSRTILENQVNTLQQQVLTLTEVVMELKEQVASLRTQRNVNDSATSKVRGSQSYSETQPREGMEMCELLNLQREVIARGKATRGNTFFTDDEEEPMEMYKVRVVVIFDKKERLFGSKGTFADIRPPAVVCWPKRFTRFVSQNSSKA